jgi:hypothetical protein
MECNGLSEIVLNANWGGKRKVGRPKLRWSDDFQADIKRMRYNS